MKKLKKRKNNLFNKKLLIVIGLLGIFLLFAYKLTITRKKTEIKYPVKEQQTTKILPSQKVSNWVLAKNIKGKTETLLSQPCYTTCNNRFPFAVWKNWFYYEDNLVIKGFNLETKQEKIIYDLEKNKKDFSKNKYPDELTSLRIIGDTLFFGFGGIFNENGIIYYINLNDNIAPIKLINGNNPRVVTFSNTNFIVESDGDGCGGWMTLYRLDSVPIQAIKISESKGGCLNGEEIIGIDEMNNVITSDHLFNMDDSDPWTGYNTYNYVASIPISNPSAKEIIISRENMPKNINNIILVNKKSQLVLQEMNSDQQAVKASYIFDLQKKSLSIISNNTIFKDQFNTKKTFSGEVNFEDGLKQIIFPKGYTLKIEEF